MSISIALWNVALHPGKKEVISPPADVRITNAALGEKLADENGRTTVKITYLKPGSEEDEREEATTILCSLTAGKSEHRTLDLVLNNDDEYTFEIVGKNTIYLTGNYIDQDGPDQDPYGSDEDSEEDYDLNEVSSDVEIDPEELDVPSDNDERFEEITEETTVKTTKKRPHDSMDVDDEKLSKAQRKKLAKKQKTDGGKAVPTGAVESATPSPAKANGEASEKKNKKDKKEKKEKKEKKDGSAGAGASKELAGGLKVRDTKVGTGKAAKKGQRVSMRYIGKLVDGKVFDSNTKGHPFWFKIGANQVIKGWDLGIAGMQVGGERTLVVPPKLGYGGQRLPGIPANSTLHFDVKLVEIK